MLIFLERFDEGLFPSIVGLRFASRKKSFGFALLFEEFFPFGKFTCLKIEFISSCVKMSIINKYFFLIYIINFLPLKLIKSFVDEFEPLKYFEISVIIFY